MALSATLVGALMGLGTQMYSNALRKLPYMHHPREHLLGMGLGVVLANQFVKWEDQLKKDLDKLLLRAKEANERRYFGGIFVDKYSTALYSSKSRKLLVQKFRFEGYWRGEQQTGSFWI